MMNLQLVSKDFREQARYAMDRDPENQARANNCTLQHFADICTNGRRSPDEEKFKKLVANLLARPGHFDVNLTNIDSLPESLSKILLEQLALNTTTNLRYLKFSFTKKSDLNGEILEAAEKMRLHNPDLNLTFSFGGKLNDADARTIILSAHPTTLNLPLCHQLSDETYKHLADKLKSAESHMKTLNLPNNTSQSRAMSIIADALPQSGLTAMAFKGKPEQTEVIDTNDFKAYCNALAKSKLASLDLSGLYSLENTELENLAEAVQQSRLKALRLPSGVTNLESFSVFGNALAKSVVTDLILGDAMLYPADTLNKGAFMAFLKSLPNAKIITTLDLSAQHHLKDEEIRALAEVLPKTGVKTLRLAGNITMRGYADLVIALRKSQVATLDLRETWGGEYRMQFFPFRHGIEAGKN